MSNVLRRLGDLSPGRRCIPRPETKSRLRMILLAAQSTSLQCCRLPSGFRLTPAIEKRAVPTSPTQSLTFSAVETTTKPKRTKNVRGCPRCHAATCGNHFLGLCPCNTGFKPIYRRQRSSWATFGFDSTGTPKMVGSCKETPKSTLKKGRPKLQSLPCRSNPSTHVVHWLGRAVPDQKELQPEPPAEALESLFGFPSWVPNQSTRGKQRSLFLVGWLITYSVKCHQKRGSKSGIN